jgi:hypothetical protein
MNPYACYLLKISQDMQNYSIILKRRISKELFTTFKWKIYNYLKNLAHIIVEFNRIGRYYKK